MRPDAFTSTERGRVRKTPEGYWAFVPAAAPRRLSLSDEVVKLLDEATGAVHRLGGVGRLIPNPHLLIGPHLRLEAVLSSRIEGTKTDVGQLLRFEAGQVPSADAADDATEVTNYIVALEHGLTRVRDGFPISVRLFREMHELLLQGARGEHRRPGELRKSPVWLGGATLDDAVFVPHPPTTCATRSATWRSSSTNPTSRCSCSWRSLTTSSRSSTRSSTATVASDD